MKAEHRKELHTNLLADRLGKLLDKAKSGSRSTSWLVWIGVGLVVVTVFVWWKFSRQSAAERSALWVQMDAALHDESGMAGKLSELAREHRRTVPGRIARFQLARRNLQDGVRTLPADPFRKEAVEKLILARDEFILLAGECADDPVLGAEALMGRARAEEALAGVPKKPDDPKEGLGSLDQAHTAYQELVKKYPNSAEGKTAAERLKTYDDATKRRDLTLFYERLREEFGTKVTPPPGP